MQNSWRPQLKILEIKCSSKVGLKDVVPFWRSQLPMVRGNVIMENGLH